MTVRWALVGAGIAGRARARAVQARDDATLVAVHRGRFADELGVPHVDREEVLVRADVVAVCSPSVTHEEWVERAIEAGRHVVVEYPLARTGEAARGLFRRARQAGLLLHVEHIELLSPATAWMKEQVAARGVVGGEFTFTSGGSPFADGEEHAWQNLSRVHRLVDVLGWPRRADVLAADGERLEVIVSWDFGDVRMTAHRSVSGRSLRWCLRAGDGALLEVVDRAARLDGRSVALPERRLFAEDTDVVMRRLTADGEHYLDEGRIVGILGLCERLGVPGPVQVSDNPP